MKGSDMSETDTNTDSKPELSFGQKAVGITFNPGGRADVNGVKQGFADLIDDMHNLRTRTTDSDQARLASIAITELQGAQMWAVKALTWNS